MARPTAARPGERPHAVVEICDPEELTRVRAHTVGELGVQLHDRPIGIGCGPGQLGADDILEMVGDGLYVQSVTGMHSGVNPVSGDFSVGAEGLMIRGGSLAEPVREVTVA